MSEPTPEAQAAEPPFYELLQIASRAFAASQLNQHGMLESIAVVFSYTIQSNDLPAGIVMGQTGRLRTPTEFIHMTAQLHKTVLGVVQSGYQLVQDLDEQMAFRANHLKKLEEQINAAEQKLAAIAGGSTGDRPGAPDAPVSLR